MDILIIGDNGLSTVGGEQESTKIILDGIKNHYNVGTIQPGNSAIKDDKIECFTISKKTRIKHIVKNPIEFVNYIRNIRKIIIDKKPKIIHTQSQISLFIIAHMKKYNLINNEIILIHTERGLYSKYNKIIRKIFYESFKYTNYLITTTKYNYDQWYPVLVERDIELKYKIIENTAGSNFEVYDSNNKNINDTFTIGFAGRYAHWKNWPLAVEIIKELEKKIPTKFNVEMAIGCLDKQSLVDTKNMYNDLKNLLGNRFNGEINIPLEEMNNFYYKTDVFILTSDKGTESFGRTLVEAMSRKNIVLTTDSGGSVEVVGKNENVLSNSKEFSNEISKYYKNKDLFLKEKSRSIERVQNNYSLKNNLTKHKELYDSILF